MLYINSILKKLEKKSNNKIHAQIKFKDYLDDFFNNEYFKDYTNKSKEYFKFIAYNCMIKRKKLSKNDIGDYLIVTLPDYIHQVTINENKKTIVLSFDSTLQEFLKEHGSYYDKSVYEYIKTQ